MCVVSAFNTFFLDIVIIINFSRIISIASNISNAFKTLSILTFVNKFFFFLLVCKRENTWKHLQLSFVNLNMLQLRCLQQQAINQLPIAEGI